MHALNPDSARAIGRGARYGQGRPRYRSLRGFTLIEMLVVTAISVLLMTVLTFIYTNALRIYNETQGLQEVYDTAKIINRDLRDAFSNVVPVPGEWINPQTSGFPGLPNATSSTIDSRYLSSGGSYLNYTEVGYLNKKQLLLRNPTYDKYFIGPQRPLITRNSTGAGMGYYRGTWDTMDASNWATTQPTYNGMWGWTMPGFFGQRDASTTALLESNDIAAGSWGWPRADYRMDVDLSDLATHGNMACWFYVEGKDFHSPSTLTLDNANINLLSIKLSRAIVDGREETKLSFLRHPIVGFDTATTGAVCEEQSFGNMMRSIKITPYTLDSGGMLQSMTDDDIGADLVGTPTGAGTGLAMPRCFDIEYVLRNRINMQPYHFSLRVYCTSNPQ